MGKKIKIIGIIFWSLISFSYAQEDAYIRPGLLTANGTLSPSKMLNRGDMNYYLTGFFEGRISKNYSLRGEIHYLLPNSNDKFLKNNLRLTSGVQYGIPFKNFEVHAGFAPGFGMMKSNIDPSFVEIAPLVQVNLGTRFYIWKYFNFFANIAYTRSQMNNLVKANGKADEIRLEAGLGLNINTK